jgi:apolipoprotein N-acyltransferase
VRAREVGAGLLAGASFAAAGPPSNLYPALWLGMAALACTLECSPVPARPPAASSAHGSDPARRIPAGVAATGLAFGVGANLVALRFVPAVVMRFTAASSGMAWLALFALAVEQGLQWGVAASVHALLRRAGVGVPLSFASGVYVGTFVPAVFPWTAAGGVTPWAPMVQLADLVGERGVTFVMALAAGWLADAALTGRRVSPEGRRSVARAARDALPAFALALGIPLATCAWGSVRMAHVEEARTRAKVLRVALVQPGTDPLERWDPERAPTLLARLTEATREAERRGAELTVWPEAAYPYPVGHLTRRCPIGPLAMLPFGVRGPVLTGLLTTGANGDQWNSAAVCGTDGALTAPQDKVHLLWFGETIPWLDRIPWVRSTFARGVGLVAGEGVVPQRVGRARAAVLNCFEDTLPAAGREAMTAGPDLLVNVTNDGWFAGSEESELHLRVASLRAVESRRDLVRAVNLGATSWVDAAGRVRAKTRGTSPEVLVVDAALLDGGPTPFDRFGDAPLTIAMGLAVTAAAGTARRHKRTKAPPPPAGTAPSPASRA